MATIINQYNDVNSWDNYVYSNENATIYHKIGWKRIIEKTFNHSSHFLLAEKDGKICGILPLVLMKSRIFGRSLISLPFIDHSGLIADTQEIASLLCGKAIELAQKFEVDFLELRNQIEIKHPSLITASHKVNFVLTLDPDPNFLWKKVFHENIRNKVRKAIKHNLYVESGNSDHFINNFYHVFSKNMRDLGTPVYPKKFFVNIAKELPQNMLIFLVYNEGQVIGGKLVLLFKDTVHFIYHSSMREYARLAPNNLLYWEAIQYSCKHNYKYCNMGRSNKNSGPFYFKKQWGGEEHQLYWQYYLNNANQVPNLSPSNLRFSLAINIWKRMPLKLTQIIGPIIAKHIP
jgi:FemAB-related protein (PEP-CTERM system-associated)